MKVLIPRLELVSLIAKIQNVAPVKPSVAALGHILIEAQDSQLILSVTDATVSMRVYLQAHVQEEGSIALPARQFAQLIRELTAPTVEIHTLSTSIAAIESGSSRFKIHGILKAEFPELPDIQRNKQFSISSSELKDLLSRTLFSAAKIDPQNTFNALCLEQTPEGGMFTSTDGKRLTRIRFPMTVPVDTSKSYLIPLKAAEEIFHILDIKDEESVNVSLMPDKIAFELRSLTLISKLFSSPFPDLSRIIPHPKPHPLSLHREELISLLRQVSLFIPEEHHAARFSFTTGELHISSSKKGQGEGSVSMPVNYAGEPLTIALNPTYFLDILRHIKDETVQLTLSDSYDPGLITDSTTALFVIMPMRLD